MATICIDSLAMGLYCVIVKFIAKKESYYLSMWRKYILLESLMFGYECCKTKILRYTIGKVWTGGSILEMLLITI